MAFLEDADPEWARHRVRSGLSSGEGLITPVRDPVWTKQPIKDKGRVVGHQDVMTDEGEPDKRLLVSEGEFGSVLRALQREGNRLSALLRSAWDGDSLATMTRSPLRATDPHISLVGHITFRELQALLSEVDVANGLANRVLWLCVRRTKYLPLGGADVDLSPIQGRFRDAAEFARGVGLMTLTPDARALFADHYARLSSPPPGVLGDVTNRATAHALRWSMLYALADQSGEVCVDHMRGGAGSDRRGEPRRGPHLRGVARLPGRGDDPGRAPGRARRDDPDGDPARRLPAQRQGRADRPRPGVPRPPRAGAGGTRHRHRRPPRVPLPRKRQKRH
jgi:hypothetical protein